MKKNQNILFLAVIVCLCACKDEYTICSQSKNVNFIGSFNKHVAGADQTATVPSFSLFLLNGTNSIYSNVSNAADFSIPLSPIVDSAKYVLSISNSLQSDTLTIVYSSVSKNLSPECGDIFVNTISRISCTDHSIQSANLVRSSVNTDAQANVKFFLY